MHVCAPPVHLCVCCVMVTEPLSSRECLFSTISQDFHSPSLPPLWAHIDFLIYSSLGVLIQCFNHIHPPPQLRPDDLPRATHLILCPFYKELSPICVAHMLQGVWPPAAAWSMWKLVKGLGVDNFQGRSERSQWCKGLIRTMDWEEWHGGRRERAG